MNQNSHRKGIKQRGVKFARDAYKRSQNILRSTEMIKGIKPDHLITTPQFVLGKKGKIYLLTIPNMYGIYLLKFKELFLTLKKKIQVPKYYRQFKEEVDSVYVSMFEKNCTIPIDEQQFGTGRARGYFLLTGKTTLGDIDTLDSYSVPFDSTQLLKIIDKFEKEDDLYK
ncbi:MAG: hypothetical protein ACFFCZ_00370 [Promethearchaeota archaeon]